MFNKLIKSFEKKGIYILVHADFCGPCQNYKQTVSMFLPTYNNYTLAVYQYKGVNKHGQDVLHQYLLEADVGDIIIIKSDFPHNGVACETSGTILFAYGDNSNIKRSES
jgi:hypothetical protein